MSKSIFLRPFKEEDVYLINKWRNDVEIQNTTTGPIRFVSLEIEKEWLKQKMLNNIKEIYLAICLNDESQKMIGYISLRNINHLNQSADGMGVIIGDKDAKDGIALLEAIEILLQYAFEQLNLNRIGASCISDHPISHLLFETFGYTKEGIQRQLIYKNGEFKDVHQYSLLKSEYLSLKEKGEYNIKNLIKRFVLSKKNFNKNKIL